MHTDEPRKNPLTDLGYETEDLNLNGIWAGAKWFFGFAFAMIGLGALLFMWMDRYGLKDYQDASAPFSNKIPAAPNPLLQGNVTTKTDIIDLRRNENNALTTPAYVDQAHGIIRIPIDHAIDLTVQRLQSGPGQADIIRGPADIPVETPTNPALPPNDTPAQPTASPSPSATPLGTPSGAAASPSAGGQR